MTEHWQVIEDALNREKGTIEELRDSWLSTTDAYKSYESQLERIDAALAFVREMRQGQGIPLEHLRVVMDFVAGYVGESLAPDDVEFAAYEVDRWLDTHSAGAEEMRDEMRAWDALSDEAFNNFEDSAGAEG